MDGSWSNWGSWGSCSVTCGAGRKFRSRKCDNPEPVNGGKECMGSNQFLVACDQGTCPGKIDTFLPHR